MPIFPDVSRRISHIFTEYYAKTSGKKLNHILTEGERAVAALKLPESNFDWWVDKNRVGQLVISYYLDVIKYKEYHFNCKAVSGRHVDVTSKAFMDEIHAQHPDPKQDKLISRAKVAAFTAKWLLKYMPIYIFPKPGYKPTEDEKIKMFHANESFALDHSTSLMGREAHLLPTETIEDILYHFKYRSSDDRSLILAFSLLSRS